jgi:hypothetical protein
LFILNSSSRKYFNGLCSAVFNGYVPYPDEFKINGRPRISYLPTYPSVQVFVYIYVHTYDWCRFQTKHLGRILALRVKLTPRGPTGGWSPLVHVLFTTCDKGTKNGLWCYVKSSVKTRVSIEKNTPIQNDQESIEIMNNYWGGFFMNLRFGRKLRQKSDKITTKNQGQKVSIIKT